jgi:hypothetical protein
MLQGLLLVHPAAARAAAGKWSGLQAGSGPTVAGVAKPLRAATVGGLMGDGRAPQTVLALLCVLPVIPRWLCRPRSWPWAGDPGVRTLLFPDK